jgi:nucleoside-diphosphate-sugar epimerase
MKTLLSLGHGYSATVLARNLIAQGWSVIGTTRNAAKHDVMRAAGVETLLWPCDLDQALARATHVLASAAPDGTGDPFLLAAKQALVSAKTPRWFGYLSTTAVYGDHAGAWVDEQTPVTPQSARAVARVLAERQWLSLDLPVHVFRLAGIYGPGRGPFEKVRDGTARRVIKPGQVFSRIHVEDIARAIIGSIDHPNPGQIYNVCDDDPARPEDVLSHAAALLGLPEPPAVPYDIADLTPMARSFYGESKRVRNNKLKQQLGVALLYPTYREGLADLLAKERANL